MRNVLYTAFKAGNEYETQQTKLMRLLKSAREEL